MRHVALCCFVVLPTLLAPLACKGGEESAAPETAGVDGGPAVLDASSGDAADGGAVSAAAPFKSGSRLKVLVRQSGGALQFNGFRDVQRNELCNPRKAADGETRCLPTNTPNEIVYTDGTCKTPVVRRVYQASPCNLGALAPGIVENVVARSTPGGDACTEQPTSIFGLGPAIATPAQVFALMEDGQCNAVTPGSGAFVAIGAEIPAASFVKLTLAEEARGPDLAARFFASDDGARALTDPRDVKHGLRCTPQKTSAGIRCVPYDRADIAATVFADATCTTKVALRYGCVSPYAASVQYGGACDYLAGGEMSLFTLGAPVSSTFTGGGSATCTAAGPSTGRAFGVGAPVAAQEFPALEQVLSGTGAVRLYEWQHGGALVSREVNFRTPEGDICFPQLVGGSARCAPPTRLYVSPALTTGVMFSDATCATRLVTAEACDTLAYVTMAPAAACAGTRVFKRGAAHTGALFTLDPSKACVAATADSGKAYYAIGEELPPTNFPEVTSQEL